MKVKKLLTLAALTAMMSSVMLGCTESPAEENADANTSEGPQVVKIGVSGPLVGDISWLGEAVTNGAQLAANEESNDDWTFELIVEDDQCDPKNAVNAYNKLKSDGVVAVVGPACSAALLAVAPLGERDEVVLLTPGATNPDVTNAGDFIFRILPSDSVAGVIAANFMYNDLGYKKVGINGKNDAWGQGLTEVFQTSFEELGGEVTTVERHETNATDLKTQLSKIQNSGAEAIYAPTFTPEMIVMAKQMEELGMADMQVVSGDAVNDTAVAEALVDSPVSVIFTYPAANEDEFAQKLKDMHMAEYGEEMHAFTGESYDSAKLIMQGIKAVGTNTAALRDYLYAVEGYPGASGTISFDSNGDVTSKEIALYTYKDGAIVGYEK